MSTADQGLRTFPPQDIFSETVFLSATSPETNGSNDDTQVTPIHMLIVESNPIDAALLKERLAVAPARQYRTMHVADLAQAKRCVATEQIDVLLLDLSLADSRGLAAYTTLQALAPELPIVILCSPEEEALAFSAIQQGAQDYLIKGQTSSYMLERGISLAIERKRLSISAQQQAHALDTERRALATLIDNIEVSMIVFDAEGHLVLVNDCWVRRNHIPREAVIGKRFDEIAEYPVAAQVQARVDHVLATGEPFVYHEWYYQDSNHPDGIYVDGSILPIIGADGKVTGARGISIDVTEKVRARQAVEGSKALLETIIEATPVGLAYLDRDMRIVDMNSTYAQWGHLDPVTAIGRVLYDVREASRERIDIHRRVLQGESVDETNVAIVSATDGQKHYYDLFFRPVRAGNAAEGEITGMITAVVDVTSRTEVERQKDNFLTLASHELRTPITSIKGYTELLLRSTDLTANARHKHFLDVIHHQVDHLTRLVNDLIDVSRIERDVLPMHLETLSLGSLALKTINNMRLLAPTRTLEIDVPAQPVIVRADRQLMEEVLANLVENALKYSPEDQPVQVSVQHRSGEALMLVRDYGLGIPQDQQTRVFERFYRATNAGTRPRNGLGLGLFITRSIVERHGGRIRVESQQGRGSTFYVALPLREDSAEDL